jgi:hypothetical protein
MIRSAFDDFIELSGPLAQLVERFHGMEEVAGPNPAWSTHRKKHSSWVLFPIYECRIRTGGGRGTGVPRLG